jgi:thiamine biosynthesis lipoprotein
LNRIGKRYLALFCVVVLMFTGCRTSQSEETKTEKEMYAMDTIMDLTIYGKESDAVMDEAVRLINRLDSLFSVTKEDSDVAKINASSAEEVVVSDETYELLKICREVSDETDGLFDVSIYPLVKAWGFTTGDEHVPSKKEREQAIKKTDYTKVELLGDNKVRIGKGMQIDLGGAAKGYLSQKLMELFQEKGIASAIVSLGGNVQTIGTKEDGSLYSVGITDPSDGTSLYGTLQVRNKAVITSGIYQRYFTENGKTYHHIMDKRTGMPADNDLASVTVISDDGEKADALATALYVMGEEKAKEYQKNHPEIEVILIRKDGSFWQSENAGMTRSK